MRNNESDITKLSFGILILIFQLFCFNIYARELKVKTLDNLLWEKRVLIVNTERNQSTLHKRVLKFKKNSICHFNERNLILITFIDGQNEVYEAPEFIRDHYGLWLIGYDGRIKSFSSDEIFLTKIFSKIDQMPMRIEEMKRGNICDHKY